MSYTYNRWKSSTVFGNFQVSDTPDSSILANGTFDRNLTIKNDLNIGQETGTPVLDGSGNVISTTYTSTGGNIKFDYNGVSYTIGKAQLIKLLNNLATESYVTTAVNNAIQSLINNSPVSLDTLQELANALGNDPNFATTVSTNLGLKANINNPTFTGTITTPNLITTTMTLNGNLTTNSTNLTPIELSRLTGITENIQTGLNNRGHLTNNNTWTGNNTFPLLLFNNNQNCILSNTSAYSNLTGQNNIIFGINAGLSNTTSAQCILIGSSAGQNVNGTNNINIGFQSGTGVSGNSNFDNVGVGRGTMRLITTGNSNTAVGHLAMENITTGVNNIAIGKSSIRNTTTANSNIAIGVSAGQNNTTGASSVIIGTSAGQNNTVNNNNVIIGFESNNSATTGNTSVYIGFRSGTFQEGNNNCAIGPTSYQGVSGSTNTGTGNCAIGRNALQIATTGSYNCSIGFGSLNTLSTGGGNSAFGWSAGKNATTSSNCTFIGNNSGIDVSGNVWNASTAIGQNATITAHNQIVLGGLNSATLPTVFIPSGRLTIGGTYRTGFYNIDVSGNINTTTGYFDNGVNINTIYQPISSMSNYYLKSEIDTTLTNYQLISSMSSYLTNANASSIYQTISGMSSYLTTANASTIYQTITGMSSYGSLSGSNAWSGTNTFNTNLPTSTLTPTLGSQFITKTYADSTYTTAGNIIGANNAWTGTNTFNTNLPTSTLTPTLGTQLITKNFSDATYQSISGMTSYLTTANASTTYQTISGMSLYLTTTNASSTYQTISGMSSYPTLSGSNVLTNLNTLNRIIINGRNNTGSNSATANIDNSQGCHIQWNRPASNGETFIINHRGTTSGNGGFRFQRYNGSGVFIDEPLQVLDTISLSRNTTLTGTFTASGLITANGGLTIPTTKVLTLTGNISANSTSITPTILSYVSELTSDAQTQLNNITSKTDYISIVNSTTTFSNDVNIPTLYISGQNADLRYLNIVDADTNYLKINDAISTYGRLGIMNTWTNFNTWTGRGDFNRLRISGRNIANPSSTGFVENVSGCHIQHNRNDDGFSSIMNHKGTATGNGGFRFQRFDGSGNYIDEPLNVGDTIYVNKPMDDITVNNSVNSTTVNSTNDNTTNLTVQNISVKSGQSEIAVNSRIRASITTPMISANTYCGVWMVNAVVSSGMTPTSMLPILGSYKNAGKFDDLWIVAPGYKVELFFNANYNSTASDPWSTTYSSPEYGSLTGVYYYDTSVRVINNTNGNTFKVLSSLQIYQGENQVGSLKVYYNNNLINLPFFS